MTHPGRAALAAIMEAAEKATPGPWKTHLVDDTSVINCDGNSVCETCAEGGIDADVDYELNWDEREATAVFIVSARNNIASVAAYVADLEAERDAAKAENERLRKALTMPDADRRQWRLAELIATVGHFNRSDLRRDFGISIPQASADIKRFIVNHPHVAKYDRTLKMYVRAALGGDNG